MARGLSIMMETAIDLNCHPREGGGPVWLHNKDWMPACASVTVKANSSVDLCESSFAELVESVRVGQDRITLLVELKVADGRFELSAVQDFQHIV